MLLKTDCFADTPACAEYIFNKGMSRLGIQYELKSTELVDKESIFQNRYRITWEKKDE